MDERSYHYIFVFLLLSAKDLLARQLMVTIVIEIHERNNSQSLIVIGSVDNGGRGDDCLGVPFLGESLHSRKKVEESLDLAPEGPALVQQKLVAILDAGKHLQEEGIRTRFCRTVDYRKKQLSHC